MFVQNPQYKTWAEFILNILFSLYILLFFYCCFNEKSESVISHNYVRIYVSNYILSGNWMNKHVHIEIHSEE